MKNNKQTYLAIVIFLIPGMSLYLFLVLNPLLQGFILSTFRWTTISKRVSVGFENYVTVFADRNFWNSIRTTFLFMVGTSFFQVILGFILGYFLYLRLKFHSVYSVIFFIPAILATVAVGFVWGYIYSPSFGLMKPLLESIGLSYNPPLASKGSALLAVIQTNIWHYLGIQIMLFNAGFMNIPTDIIEMAGIDGAHGWRMIYHMIIPLSWDIAVSVMILQIIGSLRAFDLIYVMTMGGPNRATEVLSMHMFVHAFENFNIGLGNVVAVVIFILSMTLTVITRRITKREKLQY